MELKIIDPKINDQLVSFFTKHRKRICQKGEVIDTKGNVVYLKSGLIKMYTITASGEELTLNIFKQGTFFPMLNMFVVDTDQYEYITLEKSEIMIAPVSEFEEFIKNKPEVLWDLLFRVYKGMDGLLQRMIQFMSGDAYKKTIVHLILMAKRFGAEEEGGIRITLPLTHVELSNHAGISRETVSRMMKVLENNKLIEYKRNKIVIENLERLENELMG